MKIAVLVDLKLSDRSGGHVKYWERICDSIKNYGHKIELTIFFLGEKNRTIKISQNIEYKLQKPIISSDFLKCLGIDADSTDLFPFNPGMLFKLSKYDLIHTTDQFFSMSKTAKIASKFWNIPLTTSIHTDTPPYTKYYVKKIIEKIFSPFGMDKFFINGLGIPDFYEKKMYKKVYKYINKVDHAMVADKIYSPKILIEKTKNSNITKLNRGINSKIFFIKRVSQDLIKSKFNIPKEDKIIFFSGRIHELKGAILLSKINKKLNEIGCPVTTLMAGEDIHGYKCIQESPKKLKLLGYLKANDIADLYRACDLFVFPSQFEIGPNVVLEAKACGAICLVSPNGGGKRIYKPNFDGIIIDEFSVKSWVSEIKSLLKDKRKLKILKDFISKQNSLTWHEVFINDILPYWKKKYKKN